MASPLLIVLGGNLSLMLTTRGASSSCYARDLKKDVLSTCRQFTPPFFENESLALTSTQIMFILRKTRGHHSDLFRTRQSYDGNVNACVAQTMFRRLVLVNRRSELDELRMQHIGCTS